MSEHFYIDFKVCPINQKYFVCNGKMILSQKYRQSKSALISEFSKGNKVEKPYKIKIIASQYVDIDALQKPIFDALTIAEIIEDDRFILDLHYIKLPVKKSAENEINIWIEHHEVQ